MKRSFTFLFLLVFSCASQLNAPAAETIAPINLNDGYQMLKNIQSKLKEFVETEVARLTPQLAQEEDFEDDEKQFILITIELEWTNKAIEACLEVIEGMFMFVETHLPHKMQLPIKAKIEKTKTFYTDWLHRITPALTASRAARAMLEESSDEESDLEA